MPLKAKSNTTRPLAISEVTKQFGLRASALRYYERRGILPVTTRVGGRRCYDIATLRRLAIVLRARQIGFSLAEIGELLMGFKPGTPVSVRWRQLSQRKLAELDEAIERISTMKALLQRMSNCRCDALDECGAGLLEKMCGPSSAKTPETRTAGHWSTRR